MYDAGIFRSEKFSVPVICIGNLVVGGAGKSPMAEYIIRLLKDKARVAVLSRGYGRKTKGFRLVKPDDSVANTGDEPLQFKKKFKDVTIAVAEKRVEGINQLKDKHDVIILDDAFQHRAVKAGLNILLFDYSRLNDFFLIFPAGDFREPFSGRKRADILMISKCPENLSDTERAEIKKRVKPFPGQSLFFSYLDYGNLISLNLKDERPLSSISNDTTVFLLTGIAYPQPLRRKLEGFSDAIIHHDYPDHHNFSTRNITKLADEFKSCTSVKRLIITTEKDSQRLQSGSLMELLKDLPVYYLPISAKIHQPDEARFNALIENYVAEYIQHNSIHQK